MKIIIVEDEEPARQLLRKYIADFPNAQVVDECSDGYSAVLAINKQKPDLILLDIQLPRLSGLEVLEIIEHDPQVIFTTAFDEFAIQAFERSATDYLLKPFSKVRFHAALEKAQSKLLSNPTPAVPSHQMASSLSDGAPLVRIVVKNARGINIISTSEIIYLEAQDDYVMLHTTTGRFMKKQTLMHFEARLSAEQFIRVHRSFLVSIAQIQRVEPYEKDSYMAILKNGSRIKVSSAGYKNLKERLKF